MKYSTTEHHLDALEHAIEAVLKYGPFKQFTIDFAELLEEEIQAIKSDTAYFSSAWWGSKCYECSNILEILDPEHARDEMFFQKVREICRDAESEKELSNQIEGKSYLA